MRKEEKDELTVKEGGLTYEDYARLPDDGNRYELSDGKLDLLAPAPSSDHQLVVTELLAILHGTCRDEYLLLTAPIDVILSPKEVRQPDLIMVHISREKMITQRGVEGPPDLVAEILSPSTAIKDRHVKSIIYAKYGVKEYWIVDLFYRTLEIYLLDPKTSAYRLHQAFEEKEEVYSPALPCVHFALKDLFRRGTSRTL